MPGKRLRESGILIGHLPPGPLNAITDVAGVSVGHTTILKDTPRTARTGVTVILPSGQRSWQEYVFAGSHTFTGNGEMTGVHWLNEPNKRIEGTAV